MFTINTEKLPIMVWAEPADLEGFDAAIEQAKNLANHPIARQHVALMPDFHVGYGMPIGGVFATKGGVVPNAVGVDIGCGMIAAQTDIDAVSLGRETLQEIRQRIHNRVPVGHAHHQKAQTLWEGAELDAPVIARNLSNAAKQIGTLGGGNHFIELQTDEAGKVWMMVHSGSRNIGKQVCDHYDKVARAYMSDLGIEVPDRDLAYLPDEVPEHDEYLESMWWCCRFAEESRERMLDAVEAAVRTVVPGGWSIIGEPVQTHHNYAALEDHFGEEVLVHRKGAVRAEGYVVIPGSMGTASYVAEGKASPESFRTCSHGAGRVMGRKQANREISHDEAVKAMEHVVFGIRKGDYEEMPQAYKDIHKVMANQEDLVRPVHILKPLAVVKG
jgi:tRNA-splicing ligase RtcB (3'-phosphate/5'-hydroxy nucleic acid ligase)